ncbi:MAG: hypothetical protein QW372_01835 [Nitrososphaerales archaeon]
MPWEETDHYIRSGHRDPSEFQEGTFRTITLSEEEGIKAIIAKPKRKDTTEIQSYLFDKSKGWTLDKAKAWFEKHKNEHNLNIQPTVHFHSFAKKVNEKKIKGIAAYPGISRNGNLYLPEELKRADGLQVPLFWDHDYSKGPIGTATYHWNPLGYLEFEAEYDGNIDATHVSIGAEYDYGEYFHDYFVPRNLRFYELSLTSNPGFPLTNIIGEKFRIIEHVVVNELKSEMNKMKEAEIKEIKEIDHSQTTQTEVGKTTSGVSPHVEEKGESEMSEKANLKHLKETEWTQAYINDLPDDAFAYIEPGGTKDEEGKTVPRSLRHLPYKNHKGEIDIPHLRNALARLPQTKLSDEAKAKAKAVLIKAAKQVGLPTYTEEEVMNMSEVKEMKRGEENEIKQNLTINVDVSPLKEVFQQQMQILNEIKESVKPKPQPTVMIENDEQKKIMELRKKYQRIAESLKNIRETVDSSAATSALGQIWMPELLVLPSGVKANLRKYSEVVEIPKGQDRVHFTRITTPSFSALTEGVAPSDVTHIIDRVTAIPVERGARQTITYTVLESITGDIVEAIEKTFINAAVLDEDEVILSALDNVTPAAVIYGGDATAENQIDSNDKIDEDDFSKALKEICEEGYEVAPGDLVAVLHPKQYQDLLESPGIKAAMQYGTLSNLEEGVVARLYGIDILISTKVPIGSGSGTPPITTYHAFVFKKKESVGLGISRNLLIETEKKTDERRLYITATHRIAAAVKAPKSVVKIITA